MFERMLVIPASNVSWTGAVGVSVSGNSLTKTGGTSGWNAGAASTQTITSGDGYVEFTATETNKYRMAGLSNGDTNQSYDDIDFSLYLNADGNIYIYEAGTPRGNYGAYATGDVMRVAVEGGVVKYRKNGTLLYTSTVSPAYPLLIDSSLYDTGATLTNVVVSQNSGGGSGGATINWLVTDQLGTPRMIFDQTGALANVKRHDYLPFGEELVAGQGGRTMALGYAGDAIRQKFTSKERDIETGLDYFLARYYSSTQGRFTSVDPLLESAEPKRPQSWNRYAYVLNNPLKFVDPDGLRWAQQVRDDGKTYYQWFGTDEDYDNALGNGWSAVTFDESKPFEYVSDYGVGGERNSLYVLNPDGTHGFWQTVEYGQSGSSGDFADQLALTGLFQGALKGVVGLLSHESTHGAARNASTGVLDEVLWPGRGTGRFIIRGIEYTEHAIERMAPRGFGGRGVPVSVVENAIKYGTKSPGNEPGTIVHIFENVRVVTNQAANRVHTVINTGH